MLVFTTRINMEYEMLANKTPWLLIGDLNEMVEEFDKLRGRKLFLKDFILSVGKID